MLRFNERDIRIALGLTGPEFAALVGISENTQGNHTTKSPKSIAWHLIYWSFNRDPKGTVVSFLEYWAHSGPRDRMHLARLTEVSKRYIPDTNERDDWRARIMAHEGARKEPTPQSSHKLQVSETQVNGDVTRHLIR